MAVRAAGAGEWVTGWVVVMRVGVRAKGLMDGGDRVWASARER